MVVVSYIYKGFANDVSSTFEFRRSVERLGLDLINVAETDRHVGNGEVLRLLHKAYKAIPPDTPVVYSDGADSFFLRVPEVPTKAILYSTEKAIWPNDTRYPEVKAYVEGWNQHPGFTPWRYLNGGGYCGPAGLIVEFFERYGLISHPADANGQLQQGAAYLAALKEFPIVLDQYCAQFQTIGFTEPGDFTVKGETLVNNITGTRPAVIHGNGRTAMGWVYEIMPAKEQA